MRSILRVFGSVDLANLYKATVIVVMPGRCVKRLTQNHPERGGSDVAGLDRHYPHAGQTAHRGDHQ